ncbi:hypothetical protein, partial [Phocaeicola vulgatus]
DWLGYTLKRKLANRENPLTQNPLTPPLLLPLSYGELYKTKIAIISFPMIAITSCTRSGT